MNSDVRRSIPARVPTSILLLWPLAVLSGCERNPVEPEPPAAVASLEIEPAVDTLFVGQSRRFDVTLRDSSGTVLTDRAVEWSIGPPGAPPSAYATVDAEGVVTALASLVLATTGVAVTATSEGVSGAAHLLIYPAPARAEVTGTQRVLVGREAELVVRLYDPGFSLPMPPTKVRWSSSNSAVAEVSAAGTLIGRSVGRTVITGGVPGVAEASLEVEVVDRGYRVTNLGTLGTDSSFAAALNEREQVVGWFRTGAGIPHAFLWESGTMFDLGVGDVRSEARAINEVGEIAGVAGGAGGAMWPAIWRNRELVHHLPISGTAVDIGDDGRALVECLGCAYFWTGTDTTRVPSDRPIYRVAAMNGAGVVVGSMLDFSAPTPFQAAVWSGGTGVRIATGGASSMAWAINDAGVVVGEELHGGRPNACGTNRSCGFRWEAGQRTYLGSIGPWQVTPRAVNERGEIVGTDGGRAFLWENGSMVELSAVVREPQWTIQTAADINESGAIAGQASNTSTGEVRAVLLTPE